MAGRRRVDHYGMNRRIRPQQSSPIVEVGDEAEALVHTLIAGGYRVRGGRRARNAAAARDGSTRAHRRSCFCGNKTGRKVVEVASRSCDRPGGALGADDARHCDNRSASAAERTACAKVVHQLRRVVVGAYAFARYEAEHRSGEPKQTEAERHHTLQEHQRIRP